MKYKISVIIPSHNRRRHLARALDSTLQQNLFPHEIIVIDDGSTDDTEYLIRKIYPQVRYHRQAQGGVSAARNAGIALARGDWMAFLDSDDVWMPNKLQQQYMALKDAPNYLVCHTNEIWIRNGRRVNAGKRHQKHGGYIFEQCLPMCKISPSSVLIHHEVFNQVGVFDPSLPACEDYDLWLRICSRYPVLYLQQNLIIKYGGHNDQLSKRYWGMDRFRIRSLVNILESGQLCTKQYCAAVSQLKEKIDIHLIGLKKRNKISDIDHYQALLSKYCVSTSVS